MIRILVVLLGLGAAVPSASVALPDTGLFAPVAAQLRERSARLERAAPGSPERVRLLLATGRPVEAAALATKLSGDAADVRVARALGALAVQDFAAARTRVAALEGLEEPEARSIRLAWLRVLDDAGAIDSLARARVARGDAGAGPELVALARQAFDLLDYPRAESLLARAETQTAGGDDEVARRQRAGLHVVRALVQQRQRKWDASLAELQGALGEFATPEALEVLANTLIRVGRVNDAISACEWGVRLNPYHEASHYDLGNGYARKNYTQLAAAYPGCFAGKALASADAKLAAGDRTAARAAYAKLVAAHPRWVDARIRLASLEFEDGEFARARDACFTALQACPEYGRAHAVLAKALESQRFLVDVHRAEYESRFAAMPMPQVPGIEKFVVNWESLAPRHQKRVALSVAPWKAFVPVLVDGGATFYIKPLALLLSETPDQGTLRDQRISYDSRLWDDVRGCGGFHTVTGIEDVERTIFDRYNTVTHELTHQVHQVLPADDQRVIQELYRKAKERDDAMHDAYLSRYAGGSVYEYFAEGANALVSPRRDRWDPREVVKERLDAMDPDLERAVQGYLARTDVAGSYPVAYSAGGDDRVSMGRVAEALPFYEKALAAQPGEETALVAYANALALGGFAARAESVATRAIAVHPSSGPARLALAGARWHADGDLKSARDELARSRATVTPADRYQVDVLLGAQQWTIGDGPAALAAFDSVLAYQSDNPDGLRGRANALALAGRREEAFKLFDDAVRVRTGVVELRNDFARELLFAGRTADALGQLDEARLIDEENATAEALRGWAALERGETKAARTHVRQALAWGPWSDLARIVEGGIAARTGDPAAAERAWADVRSRIARKAPPEWTYRARLATWEEVHTLPAVEKNLLDRFAGELKDSMSTQ